MPTVLTIITVHVWLATCVTPQQGGLFSFVSSTTSNACILGNLLIQCRLFQTFTWYILHGHGAISCHFFAQHGTVYVDQVLHGSQWYLLQDNMTHLDDMSSKRLAKGHRVSGKHLKVVGLHDLIGPV